MSFEKYIDDSKIKPHLDSPEFGREGRVHDWRNHVPDMVKGAWESLSMETRFVVYAMAKEQANNEEWD